jgi:hypothetical protein
VSGIANRQQSYDLSKVQRAARPEACARRAEIPATPRVSRAWLATRENHADQEVSRAWLATRENHADQDALSQGPAGLVADGAKLRFLRNT